jgi:AbrB family looped-hinge helix DNA binding protein
MHNKKLYGTATVGTKGQIVIPALAREELNINTGDKIYVVGSPNQGVVMLLKEDKIERFIEHLSSHIESFKALKNSQKD